jgi:hypothetical protein
LGDYQSVYKMETPILIICSLILVALTVYIFIYIKNIRSQKKISQEYADRLYQKLEEAQKLIQDNHTEVKSTNEVALNLVLEEIDRLKNAITLEMKELAKNYEGQNKLVIEKFNQYIGTLITENNTFKHELGDTHKNVLHELKEIHKAFQKELSSILTEIKKPLNLD